MKIEKDECSGEDEERGKPMVDGERVFKEEDGDQEAEELAKGDDESDGEGCELRRQHEHATNAYELRDAVTEHEEPQPGHVEVHPMEQ